NTDYRPVMNLDQPDLSKTYAVRCVCFTLDGNISDITLTIPGFTSMYEIMEVAAMKVEDIISHLTSYFTAFRAYQIQIGYIDQDGTFIAQSKQPVREHPIREEWSGHFVNVYANA